VPEVFFESKPSSPAGKPTGRLPGGTAPELSEPSAAPGAKSEKDELREFLEKQTKEFRRQTAQAQAASDQARRDDFDRWLKSYDQRRSDARKLQDREDFARSLDQGRLKNLEFLAQMGAIDEVSGFGAAETALQRAGQTDKLEGQLRHIESPERRKARTRALEVRPGPSAGTGRGVKNLSLAARPETSRLDPAALDFLPTGQESRLGA
jgi:hypothetical protein